MTNEELIKEFNDLLQDVIWEVRIDETFDMSEYDDTRLPMEIARLENFFIEVLERNIQ